VLVIDGTKEGRDGYKLMKKRLDILLGPKRSGNENCVMLVIESL
jgi:hypothetical protein